MRSILLLVPSLALVPACSADVQTAAHSEGTGGGGGSPSGLATCPTPSEAALLAFGHEACAAAEEGLACPWLYGDTGGFYEGVVACQSGQWNGVNCPALELSACPAPGAPLGIGCDAPWEGIGCPWSAPTTDSGCSGDAVCQANQWRAD